MKINELLNGIECEKINFNEEIDINSVAVKDYECKKGSAFFCLNSNSIQLDKYVQNAIKLGASVIISEKIVNNCTVAQVVVNDAREALTIFCKKFYKNPQKKLFKIAVVGTNGKTTVCELIYRILNAFGKKCGKIGTFGVEFAGKKYQTGFTTPDSHILYASLRDMVDNGIEVVCMELSAHAIYYKKADFQFDIVVFTNCSPEHLDFFEDYNEYKQVKISAFDRSKAKVAVVNADDVTGKEILCLRNQGVISYGLDDPCDIFAIDFYEDNRGISFLINLFDELYEIKSRYHGKYNVYNMLAVACTCALAGVNTDFIAKYLSLADYIPGRMQKVCNKIKVYVDYAHTPDGLEKSLASLKKIRGNKKLICLFGCGGNRDRFKRKLMGKISGELADFTVITSDNPRFEDENAIIDEIEKGIREVSHEYISIRDREEAIEYAVQIANVGDYILIAGKGAEEFQERMGVFKPFSDIEIAQKAVKNKYDEL